MKVSELKGGLLSYWAAKAEGFEPVVQNLDSGDIGVQVRRESGYLEIYRAGVNARMLVSDRFGNEVPDRIG